MFMLITYITCFAIYLATQQCINLYFRGNISPFMTENNSSRFFWTPGKIMSQNLIPPSPSAEYIFCQIYCHCHGNDHSLYIFLIIMANLAIK